MAGDAYLKLTKVRMEWRLVQKPQPFELERPLNPQRWVSYSAAVSAPSGNFTSATNGPKNAGRGS